MDYTNILTALVVLVGSSSVLYYRYKYLPEKHQAKLDAVQGFKDACTNGNATELKKLYEKYGSDVCDLTTGLVLAANKGYNGIINFLIDQGANNYNAGLYSATEGGHNNCIKLFLEKGATNVDDCLKIACQKSNRTAVELLLKFGANPSVGIVNTNTPTLLKILLDARSLDASTLSLHLVD
jgi:ankyrin repeat protein